MARRHDRPARRERVGGRAGRGGDDHAVGRVRGEERAVDLDLEARQPPGVDLLEHRLVEREPAAARGPRRLDVDLEHHALGDLVVAGEQRVEGGVEVGGLDLGEVARSARRSRRAPVRRPRTTRSTARSMVPSPPSEMTRSRPWRTSSSGHREVREPGRVGVRRRDRGRRRRARPARCRGVLGEIRRGTPRSRWRHEPDGAERHSPAPTALDAVGRRDARRRARRRRAERPCRGRERTRNSTLPSAPRSGDGITSVDDQPGAARPSRDLAEHGGVHVGSRTTPPLPTRARPGLELRLHQQHQVGVGCVQRDERGRDGDAAR